jgi:tRNA (mo5U34)-methyltransferase
VDEEAAALQREVDAIPYWHHTMSLGDGVITPGGGGDTSHGLRRIALPEDLTGKTVLDIGAWDGFYSFECERRGAARILATDHFVWRQLRPDGKTGFELARRALGSHVEDMEIDVFDISPETVGMFDIVLFLGVLYHLRDPFGGLAHAASVTRELLIVETHVDLLDLDRPAIAFYPGAELAGDATNWCGPNVPAVVGMLDNLGLNDADVVSLEPRVGDQEWLQTTGTGNGTQGTRRAVVHGRRGPALRN